MSIPKLSIQEVSPFITVLFQGADSSFQSTNVSTGVPSEPKELVFYVEGLAMTTMARVSDGVDAMGKDLRVVVVDGGDGRYGRRKGDVFGHKRSLPPIN